MAEPPKKESTLRLNAEAWNPQMRPNAAAAGAGAGDGAEVGNGNGGVAAVVNEPASTRFRISSKRLEHPHHDTTCYHDSAVFARELTRLLAIPDLVEIKRRCEVCRDSRIQGTLGYSYMCPSHLKVADVYINLRELFEYPITKGTTVEYKNIPGEGQFFLLQSPEPIYTEPWYGATKIRVTNTGTLIEEAPSPELFKLAVDASNLYWYVRELNRHFLRYTIVQTTSETILTPEQRASSCIGEILETINNDYKVANVNLNSWKFLYPSLEIASFSGGKRSTRRSKRKLTKRKRNTRKIGNRK